MSYNLYPNVKDVAPDAGVDYGKSVSGMYTALTDAEQLELKIDVDQPGRFQQALKVVSGTLKALSKPKWSGKATTAFFTTYLDRAVYNQETGALTAQLAVSLSDGGKREGSIDAVARRNTRGGPSFDVTIKIESATFVYKGVTRKSQHYRDIKLDIDYVDKLTVPGIQLKDFNSPAYGNMKDREVNIVTAFTDAGLKLNFNMDDTTQVEDPTPYTPWSKDDMVKVMDKNFQQGAYFDDSIWCLMATHPPDDRYMGFSFDFENKRGFGLFLGHKSFKEVTSDNPKVRAKASRRLLHYLVHECGHCMGLKHPFEEGNVDSMSWMNYAWKYDGLKKRKAGDFYKNFKFTFSREELLILRHQPDKLFKQAYKEANDEVFEFVPPSKSAPPDYLGGYGYEDEGYGKAGYGEYDDEEELEDDDEQYGGYQQGPAKRRKTEVKAREVVFDINTKKTPYKKGDIVELQTSLTNVGKLPAKIEANFEPGGGNLTVYVTDPQGYVKTVKPVAQVIDSPTRNYAILGKPGSRDYAESYSESVPLLQSSYPMFNKVGTYKVKAVYQSGGVQMASKYSTITIEEEDEEDEAAKYEVAKAASLETSASYGQQSAPVNYWKKLAKKTSEKKAERVQMMLLLLKGFAKDAMEVSGDRGASGGRKVKLKTGAISPQKLLADTDDLLNYYHNNPGVDPLNYNKLVNARSQLYAKAKKVPKADGEYAQLVADLVRLKENKTGMVQRAIDDWEKLLSTPEPYESPPAKPDRKKLQSRFEKLFWFKPTEKFEVDNEASGLGLSRPFNNFDGDHKAKATYFIDELQDLEDETDDLDAVLDYAEARQKSFEVNPSLYKWAIECYVVHSPLAKSYHITYPEPKPMAEEMFSAAAMIETKRSGKPAENWMNYWRCDADFNFHHRHWHTVYSRYSFSQALAKRQGELFLYMHSQMLARYDAERESWGLKPVKAFGYNETPRGFNAGFEFHKDHGWYLPREDYKPWPEDSKDTQERFENELLKLYENKSSENYNDGRPIDANDAGFLMEPSNYRYYDFFGGFHNAGHMAFCAGLPEHYTTYMGSSECAVRDPIFFRWHKRVDNVADNYFASKLTEMENENPGVIIEPTDVLVQPGTDAPDGFDKFSNGKWTKKNFPQNEIKTDLKKATLMYEWDNKLTHEPFSFHFRIRRSPGTKGTLNLTVRVFICQERHVLNRKRWIEMDKFVHRMPDKVNHCVLKRLDINSSVIKRKFENLDEQESKFCATVAGNCECGWPYEMMLPRGTKAGEKWCVAVFVSNNDIDNIKMRTKCGSMSYCGTRDENYPDSRFMGFPFATPISIKGTKVTITKAMEEMSNFSMAPFTIYNNLAPEEAVFKPEEPVDVWKPSSVVPNVEDIDYRPSRLTGRFRVLLDDQDFSKMGVDRVKLRLKGRGEKQTYTIHDMYLGTRDGNSLSVDPKSIVSVTYKNNTSMEVPPDGVFTDEIVLPIKPTAGTDFFVTFTLDQPGCYVKSKINRVNSYRIPPSYDVGAGTPPTNWDGIDQIRSTRSLYCIEKMVEC